MSKLERPLRVVYFVSLFPCWSETFIVREIQQLLKLGVDVRIVSLKRASEKLVQSDAQALLDRVLYPVAWPFALARVLSQLLRHPLREVSDLLHLVLKLARHPSALAKSLVVWWRTLGLLPEIRVLAPDHLHAHWATYPSTAALWAARRLRVPFSFTAHAHDIFVEDHLLAEKMYSAAFGVTISEFNRQYLATHASPIALQCLRIVHCGVSPSDFAFRPDGRRPGFIMAVGRLDEIKGFAHLVDACALLQQRGVAFDCAIVGEGPLRPMLEAMIAAAGLGDRVKLLGARKQEEVRELLSQAAVFVLPSVVTPRGDRDGIPVALMEAMAVGLPVVSTRVSGIPELVVHGSTGLLADEKDAAGLADAIAQLFGDPVAAKAMAAEARRKVEREFDVAREAQKLLAAIQGLRLHAVPTAGHDARAGREAI
jgi:colanic acid/amylovoran biosynthesis glycosyltransferase